MQTNLAPEYKGTREGEAAEAILRKCVHCGFCTATCPTYQLLGDELDGPRGRIYLIKQALEGGEVTASTQAHLDRCLTCRNCESTCPSGVQYGQLVEIGRHVVDAKVPRSAGAQAQRWALKEGLTSPLFVPAMAVGKLVRPVLPASLKAKVPKALKGAAAARAKRWPQLVHKRKVLMLMGCVQPAMLPNINSATARVLDACGIQTLVADGAGCCGAVRAHLGDPEGGLADARRNIDAWWPLVEGLTSAGKVEAIVMNASACGLQVKEYGKALAHDLAYREKAAKVSALTKDLSELLPDLVPRLKPLIEKRARAGQLPAQRLVFHPPCTLQHGQQLRGVVERELAGMGYETRQAMAEPHLCCGSAGTYSVLQPELSAALRERKLNGLAAQEGEVIISANVGCIAHLQSGTRGRVAHWVEVLDEALP